MDNKGRKDRNVQLWIDALRSGLYKQGLGCLHKNDEFCCLGVACEVYQKKVGDLVVESNDFVSAYDGHTKFLPQKVQDWLGLSSDDGLSYLHSSLTFMNDKLTSFDKIADFIESRPAGLFMEEGNTNE